MTTCVYGRRQVLGSCARGTIELTPLGRVVRDTLLAVPDHWPVIALDAWVVMPDHVHAILVVTSALPAGLPQVVGSFKAASTKLVRRAGLWSVAPLWQRSFHDRRLAGADATAAARRYVAENPLRWRG